MDIARLNTNIYTQTAIAALKNAYDQCNDNAAKESIISAFKAVIQLHNDLGRQIRVDRKFDIEKECDPSEYCSAI